MEGRLKGMMMMDVLGGISERAQMDIGLKILIKLVMMIS